MRSGARKAGEIWRGASVEGAPPIVDYLFVQAPTNPTLRDGGPIFDSRARNYSPADFGKDATIGRSMLDRGSGITSSGILETRRSVVITNLGFCKGLPFSWVS